MDNIENKVAFGVVFDEGDMGTLVHGVPLKQGCLRVSIDGCIRPDALVPVPVVGEIEMVHQAVGSQLAWPQELIIFTTTAPIVEVYIFFIYLLNWRVQVHSDSNWHVQVHIFKFSL